MRAAGAIADDVRREILELLQRHPMTAGGIAAGFSISRPAVSRHLRVLRDAGLVHDEPIGRERVYRLDTAPLREVAAWIAALDTSARWDGQLDALETEVARTRRDRRSTSRTAERREETA